MASPHEIAFVVYNADTGAPVTGGAGSMSFTTYKDETGTNLAHPTIVEVGGGVYKFTPSFIANHSICYIVYTGSNTTPLYYSGFVRPEDFNIDNIDVPSSTIAADVSILKTIETGKWKIFTSGPDANRLVLYDVDETTPLYKFDLADSVGTPTTTNPFSRTPV